MKQLFFVFFFAGTWPPFLRALDRPMAIACFLLLTVLPDLPLFCVPFLVLCTAFLTSLFAFLPYLAMTDAPRDCNGWPRR